jgi:hypothetical protein
MNRRSFLSALIAVPVAAIGVKVISDPYKHPWVYKPSETQRRFIENDLRNILYGGRAGGGKSYQLTMTLHSSQAREYSKLLDSVKGLR